MPSTSLPSDTPPREPQLLRFRLSQLFLIVTLTSVFCALLTGTSGVWPLVILVGVLLVGAHICGNLIGTRLRDTSHEVVRWRADQHGPDVDRPAAVVDPNVMANFDPPPPTPLASFGHKCSWVIILALAGALLGAALGGIAIALTIGSRITWAGLAVGTISCAVLGAWLGFLATSFSSIARHAWRNAHEGGK